MFYLVVTKGYKLQQMYRTSALTIFYLSNDSNRLESNSVSAPHPLCHELGEKAWPWFFSPKTREFKAVWALNSTPLFKAGLTRPKTHSTNIINCLYN